MSQDTGELIELPIPPVHMRIAAGSMALTGLLLIVIGALFFKSAGDHPLRFVFYGVSASGLLSAICSIGVGKGHTWAVILGIPLTAAGAAGSAFIFLAGALTGGIFGAPVVGAAASAVNVILLIACIGPARRITRARHALERRD